MAETVRQELHRLRLIARHIGKLSPASREWLRDALNDERVQWGEDTNVLPPLRRGGWTVINGVRLEKHRREAPDDEWRRKYGPVEPPGSGEMGGA